jgi:hypothetical protein
MSILQSSGIFGLIILLLTPMLMVAGIIVVAVTKSRRAAYSLCVAALFPLMLGILGTFLGYMAVNETAKVSKEQAVQSHIESGRSEARAPGYVGLAASAIVLMAGGIGVAVTKKAKQE